MSSDLFDKLQCIQLKIKMSTSVSKTYPNTESSPNWVIFTQTSVFVEITKA